MADIASRSSTPLTSGPSSTTSSPPTEIENETSPLLKTTKTGASKKRTFLKDFTRLSPDVSLYIPPKGTPSPPPDHPTTIIFCAWMNASLKHVDYYTRTYRTLYPQTRILTVRISTAQFMFTSESTRRQQIAPAVSALLSFEAENGIENERLVVHLISNGGAKRAYGIAGLYLEKTGRSIPTKAFLCDCSPGIPQFKRDFYAITVPFERMSVFARLPLYLLTLLLVSVVNVCVHWFPPEVVWPELVWRPTRLFNEPGFLGNGILRGYVYCEEDLSIDFRDVERHAEVAEEKGYRVFKKKVMGGGHALLWKGKGGEGDYWGWIRRFYEVGFGIRETLNG